MSLETAPDHIKLAVDLIELLETNKIDNRVAEQALEIVLKDIRAKMASESPSDSE
ncbi:MAG: DUF2496 domain-containing protein [Oceanospirillum sp.]|nr:DUF2496 domain-containing protein [Oceanospirillum sp.]